MQQASKEHGTCNSKHAHYLPAAPRRMKIKVVKNFFYPYFIPFLTVISKINKHGHKASDRHCDQALLIQASAHIVSIH